jgi:hypothetical protein
VALIHSLRHVWDYLFALCAGNVVSTPVIFALGLFTDRLLFKPARKLRERQTAEIHRLLHHEHAATARALGQTPHGGWQQT